MKRNLTSRRGAGIRNILIGISLLFLLIPTIFNMIVTYRGFYSKLREKELERARIQLELVSENLNDRVQRSENTLAGFLMRVEDLYGMLLPRETHYEYFLAQQNAGKVLSTVPYSMNGILFTFVSADNRVLTNGTPVNMAIRLDDPTLQKIIENKDAFTITARNLFSHISSPVVTIGRPVYYKGRFVGVMFADLYFRDLDMEIGQKNALNSKLYLFDKDGQLLYYYDRDESTGVLIREKADLSSILEGRKNYFLKDMQYGNITLTSLIIPDESELFRDSRSQLWQTAALSTLLLLVGAMLAWFFGSKLSRDFVTMSEAVEQYAQDGKAIQLDLNSGVKEVKRLETGIENMSKTITDLIDEVKKKETERHQLEIRTLMSQINPHMIYNTLNTITFLAEARGIRNIAEVSDSLIKMLQMLSNIEGECLTIRQEYEYLQAYVRIKKYNLLCPLRLEMDVQESTKDLLIPKNMLQPFVENSIKHAFNDFMDEGVIKVQIRRNKDRLLCSISDNGNGISSQVLENLLTQEDQDETHIGIYNTYQRMKLFYNDDCRLTFDSDGKSFTEVKLDIPAQIPINAPEGDEKHEDHDRG